MMRIDTERYDYIQARLQARHAQHPDAALWQRLGALRDLPLFLQTGRASGLRPWLEGLAPDTSPHRMEQLLRQRFRNEVRLVADWQPRPWQAATAWIAHWMDLPALGGLLRRETVPEWMYQDPDYAPLARLPRAARGEALLQTRWAPLLNSPAGNTDLRQAWFDHWRHLWPGHENPDRAGVEALAQGLAAQPSVRAGTPAADRRQREQWRAWLLIRFRRMTRAPVSAMLYLFLVEQDIERLRGALLQRRLFPDLRTEDADGPAP
jgi:hypothetical protein